MYLSIYSLRSCIIGLCSSSLWWLRDRLRCTVSLWCCPWVYITYPWPFRYWSRSQGFSSITSRSPLWSTSSFFRTVTTRGLNRPFPKFLLGQSSTHDSIGKVNSRLPEYLQLKNLSDHSPRRSMITISVNSNDGPVVVALATKHKNPKSFLVTLKLPLKVLWLLVLLLLLLLSLVAVVDVLLLALT